MSPLLRRKLPLGLLMVLAASLSGAALAWACTPQATIGLSSASGPAGTSLAVSGRVFTGGDTVQIRWNSAAGPVLATATASPQGTFSTSIAIPSAPPDTYTVVAVSGRGFIATSSYTIVGAPTGSPSSGGGGTTTGAPGSNPSSGNTSGGNDGSVGGGGSSGSDNATANGGGSGSGSGFGRGGDTAAGGGDGNVPSDDRTGLAESASGETVFADSVGSDRERRSATSSDPPSARSAAADLWAGFGSPASSILSNPSASPATGGSMPALTAALLGLGLVAGLGGLGVAAARRRRAHAGASSD